jgi:hypothetical protein
MQNDAAQAVESLFSLEFGLKTLNKRESLIVAVGEQVLAGGKNQDLNILANNLISFQLGV